MLGIQVWGNQLWDWVEREFLNNNETQKINQQKQISENQREIFYSDSETVFPQIAQIYAETDQ